MADKSKRKGGNNADNYLIVCLICDIYIYIYIYHNVLLVRVPPLPKKIDFSVKPTNSKIKSN